LKIQQTHCVQTLCNRMKGGYLIFFQVMIMVSKTSAASINTYQQVYYSLTFGIGANTVGVAGPRVSHLFLSCLPSYFSDSFTLLFIAF